MIGYNSTIWIWIWSVPISIIPISVSIPIVSVSPHVKVEKDIESWVPVIPPPKRIRDIRIHVCIIGRRRVVGDYRRSFIIVIIIDNGGFGSI
jgi:hypothetical protein